MGFSFFILNKFAKIRARVDTNNITNEPRTRSFEGTYGKGEYSNWKDGLYDDQIHKIMESKTRRFVPVIMSDEIPKLLPYVNKNTKQFGFIINSTSSHTEGQHWRAVFLNFQTGEMCYYDSLVSQPSKQFLKDIKLLIDKVDPPFYMLEKINMIKQQKDDTNSCGFMACKFLIDMFRICFHA